MTYYVSSGTLNSTNSTAVSLSCVRALAHSGCPGLKGRKTVVVVVVVVVIICTLHAGRRCIYAVVYVNDVCK